MRFLHCSDLHLGRRLGELDLAEDQEYMLHQLVQLAAAQAVDAVLIAGDIYDRSVPGIAAVRLLDQFLSELAEAGLPVYLISGNHDSAERLEYASGFMARRGIHVASLFTGTLQRYELRDQYGPLTLWALPFVKPGGVRHYWPEETIESYTDAVRTVIDHAGVDFTGRNLLMAHQFVISGDSRPEAAGSESVNVGTLDHVDASVFDGFDYVALGHIHGAQSAGRPQVRYCGTPLKYSVAEARQQKSVLLVEMGPKGQVSWQPLPLPCLRDLRRVEGPLETLIARGEESDDYIYAVLTDDAPVMDAAARLRAVYPNLVKIDFRYSGGSRARQERELPAPEHRPPLELFDEFYASVHGSGMSDEERAVMQEVFEEVCL